VYVCWQEDYPHSPPIWFSESDDAVLSAALEKLSETSPENNTVRVVGLSVGSYATYMLCVIVFYDCIQWSQSRKLSTPDVMVVRLN